MKFKEFKKLYEYAAKFNNLSDSEVTLDKVKSLITKLYEDNSIDLSEDDSETDFLDMGTKLMKDQMNMGLLKAAYPKSESNKNKITLKAFEEVENLKEASKEKKDVFTDNLNQAMDKKIQGMPQEKKQAARAVAKTQKADAINKFNTELADQEKAINTVRDAATKRIGDTWTGKLAKLTLSSELAKSRWERVKADIDIKLSQELRDDKLTITKKFTEDPAKFQAAVERHAKETARAAREAAAEKDEKAAAEAAAAENQTKAARKTQKELDKFDPEYKEWTDGYTQFTAGASDVVEAIEELEVLKQKLKGDVKDVDRKSIPDPEKTTAKDALQATYDAAVVVENGKMKQGKKDVKDGRAAMTAAKGRLNLNKQNVEPGIVDLIKNAYANYDKDSEKYKDAMDDAGETQE